MRTGHNRRPVRIFYSVKLSDLKSGASAKILSVSCEASLKERLRALNLRAGERVRLEKKSFFGKTLLIRAGGTLVAIRKEVAECVEVR